MKFLSLAVAVAVATLHFAEAHNVHNEHRERHGGRSSHTAHVRNNEDKSRAKPGVKRTNHSGVRTGSKEVDGTPAQTRDGGKPGNREHDMHNPKTEVETKDAEKRAFVHWDHTYDDFVPEVQDICNADKTFDIDGCEVSYVLDDMDATEFDHIFEVGCGGYAIIVTMDLEDGLPAHANKVASHTEHWAELIAMPGLEGEGEEGCLFAVVTSLDIDPDKMQSEFMNHPKRRLLGADNFRRYAGSKGLFPINKPEKRELSACSDYTVIKLGLLFDHRFCHTHGGGNEESSKAFLHSVIATANQWFQAAPLCFRLESGFIDGTCSSSNDPIKSLISDAAGHCFQEPSLPTVFAGYLNGNMRGCDAVHLVFGDTPFGDDTDGCAEIEALCTDKGVGSNNYQPDYTQHYCAALLSHELGHTLSLGDFYPEEKTYLMGTGYAGFKEERMWKMKEYVQRRQQEQAGCAGGSGSGGGGSGSTGSCTDLAGWTDVEGDGCDWYEEEDVYGCPNTGAGASSSGVTADQACCHCGQRSGFGGGDGGSTGSCADLAGWTDVEGDGCNWYEDEDDYGCPNTGAGASSSGVTADEACCHCGQRSGSGLL